MLSSSGDDFAIPHDSNPLSDDVLAIVGGHLDVHLPAIVGGHLDVHLPAILLVLWWHVWVPVIVLEAAYFSLVGVHCSGKLVDALSGFM